MFPRAARFSAEHGNDVPGPNAYDPSQPEAHYKRGAMFERDARFRAAAEAAAAASSSPAARALSPSMLCPHGCLAASSVATTSRVKLDAVRLLSVEKEKAKLEVRAAKADEKVAELQAQAAAWQRERKQMQTDARLAAQRLERTQAQAQQATTPTRSKARLSTSLSPSQQRTSVAAGREEAEAAAAVFASRIQTLEQTQADERQATEAKERETEDRHLAQMRILQCEFVDAQARADDAERQAVGLQEELNVAQARNKDGDKRIAKLQEEMERLHYNQTLSSGGQDDAEKDRIASELDQQRDKDRAENERLQSRLAEQHDEHERVKQQRNAWFVAALLLLGENSGLRSRQVQEATERIHATQAMRLQESLAASEQQVKDLKDVLSLARQTHVAAVMPADAEPSSDSTVGMLTATEVEEEPLDEREAARRAWQQRPRTRVVRVDVRRTSAALLRELPRGVSHGKRADVAQVPPLDRLGVQARSTPCSSSSEDGGDAPSTTDGASSVATTVDLAEAATSTMALLDVPKRRYLRPQRSDSSLDRRDRSSPVASLPSMDALAWELDKENANRIVIDPPKLVRAESAPRPAYARFLLDGELGLRDLTGRG